jgi:hypothetical protein
MTGCSQAAEETMCPWYNVGGKMSDKNLEQWINTKFCVKIGRSASEMLTFTYCECAKKVKSVFQRHRWFKEGREDMKDDPRSRQPKM